MTGYTHCDGIVVMPLSHVPPLPQSERERRDIQRQFVTIPARSCIQLPCLVYRSRASSQSYGTVTIDVFVKLAQPIGSAYSTAP